MSGLCGWMGWGSDGGSQAMLARMADHLPDSAANKRSEALGKDCALALLSQPADGDYCSEQELLVAIKGYPRWSRPDLARLSQSEGPAKALAEAYRSKGIDLFEELFGAFSFAILDPNQRSALLAIDRLGIEPLCYATGARGSLIFGSTTDSVKAHDLVDSTIRLQSIFDFFHFIDRIPSPHTIYRAQMKLPPAHFLHLKDGKLKREAYWRMPYREDQSRSFDSLAEELNERLGAAVARNLEGENLDRLGAYLSGGLDSSSLLGALATASDRRPRTFTIGFKEERYDESRYARIAASHFNAEHDVFVMEPQHTFEAAAKIFQAFDEPFANSSALPAYHCALRAKEAGIEVMLAGDGGDELFAGNSRYVKDGIFDYYARVPAVLRRGLMEPIAKCLPMPLRVGLFRKGRNYVNLAKLSVAARMTNQNIYQVVDPGEIFATEFLAEIDPQAPIRLAEAIYDAAPSQSKIHKMMYLDLQLTIADSDIRKVSRMCELAGVRVRYPFLDDDLVAFSATLPPDLLLRGGRIRDFYKRAMANLLPKEILDKPKHGFGLPYPEHVSGYPPLRDYCVASLESLKGRGYIKGSFIDRMKRCLSEPSQGWYHGITWDFVALEHWFQSRLD